MYNKKQYIKDKYSIITTIQQQKHHRYYRGNKYYIKRLSHNRWLIWNMIDSYLAPYEVIYDDRWIFKIRADAPSWNELREMNYWNRQQWVEDAFGNLNKLEKTHKR